MKCKECGRPMRLDDVDRNFKGNEDKYWVCEHCMTSCIEQVRYGQTWRELWHSENDGCVDHTIKHEIRFR